MSWVVYGFMHPWDTDSYGPLPRKRWVREIPHRRHKLAYRWHYAQRGAETADSYNERQAIQYAEWLANRDGLAVPDEGNIKKRCDWSAIYSTVKTQTSRHWDGSTSTRQAYSKRIRAVEWGTEWKEEIYNTRKDGRRGAWSRNIMHFEVKLRVEIPHWDFEHPEPIEELLEQAA